MADLGDFSLAALREEVKRRVAEAKFCSQCSYFEWADDSHNFGRCVAPIWAAPTRYHDTFEENPTTCPLWTRTADKREVIFEVIFCRAMMCRADKMGVCV